MCVYAYAQTHNTLILIFWYRFLLWDCGQNAKSQNVITTLYVHVRSVKIPWAEQIMLFREYACDKHYCVLFAISFDMLRSLNGIISVYHFNKLLPLNTKEMWRVVSRETTYRHAKGKKKKREYMKWSKQNEGRPLCERPQLRQVRWAWNIKRLYT